MKNRTLLGIISLVAFSIILELYESPPAMITFHLGKLAFQIPSVGSFLVLTLLFSIATVIARGQFLKAAVIFSVIVWVVLQVMLYRIALPSGPADFISIAFGNLPALLAYLLAAVLGTRGGSWYYAREFKQSEPMA